MIPEAALRAATVAFIEHGTLLPVLEAAAPHMTGPSLGERFAQDLHDEFYYQGPRDEPTL